MSPERRREISRLGGLAAQRAQTAHRWTSKEARQAALRARANSKGSPQETVVAPVMVPPNDDEWRLAAQDGRILECRIDRVAGGFEICAGYIHVPVMYSAVYEHLEDARSMLASWWEAAIARGQFQPIAVQDPHTAA